LASRKRYPGDINHDRLFEIDPKPACKEDGELRETRLRDTKLVRDGLVLQNRRNSVRADVTEVSSNHVRCIREKTSIPATFLSIVEQTTVVLLKKN